MTTCEFILSDKSVIKQEYGIVGTHFEMQEQWLLFDKLKDKELIDSGIYHIGIFTNVEKVMK